MTKITKSNVDAAMRDDAAHIDYLKRDVLDDQKYGGKYKDENQTADEKHISKLAGDIKHDVHDKSFLSKHWSHNRAFSNESPLHLDGDPLADDWGGESVEMQDQVDSPVEYSLMTPLAFDGESYAGKGGQKSEPSQTIEVSDGKGGTKLAPGKGGQTLDDTTD